MMARAAGARQPIDVARAVGVMMENAAKKGSVTTD